MVPLRIWPLSTILARVQFKVCHTRMMTAPFIASPPPGICRTNSLALRLTPFIHIGECYSPPPPQCVLFSYFDTVRYSYGMFPTCFNIESIRPVSKQRSACTASVPG